MSITLESVQEVGFHADNGRMICAKIVTESSILIKRQYIKDEQGRERPSVYLATITTFSAVTGETVSTYERGFSSLEKMMELLGIDDIDEVWQVLD